jgi:hypothetical protein
MQLGQQISIAEIPGLGLGAMDADLGVSELRRDVKIYKVPTAVSEDRYYISVTDAGGIEQAPASRAKNTMLLAHYNLDAGGKATVYFIHGGVQNA